MFNAAIIVFRRSSLPKILKFFAIPGISRTVEAGSGDRQVRIHIIECPVMKRPADNRKLAKSLKSLCLDNNIDFFIGRNIEYYFESSLESIENTIERGNIEEIKAIKGLAALIKLSAERNDNLLKKNICFIGESCSYRYISTMSEEAAGVFIYEHDKMSNSSKRMIFERLMSEKGISAAFTKDLGRAVSQCDIIAVDDTVGLEEYQKSLSGKILIGENPVSGDFEKISQVRLWYESMEGLAEDNAVICFNDEILGILRHFYKEKNPIDFIRKFPYIHMSRN
jgi:hypothetical protein